MHDLQLLIIKAQNGDLDAFGRLVRRFQNMVYGYAYGILGDFHLAEDVAQETFLEVYRQLSELRNTEAFSAWLRAIVYKYCDRLTRRKQIETVHLDAVSNLASPQLGPDDVIVQKDVQNRMAQIIQNLPEKERVVTLLFYMNEHALKEIALFLEVPVSTVKNRLYSARQLMKERMANMADDGLLAFRLPERFSDVIVQMQFVLGKINPLEKRMQALKDDQLAVKGAELEQRLKRGERRDEVKAEAFALVKEVSRRVLGLTYYDVQLVAGVMMDAGWVAEMGAGEGKSLACLLPAYLAVLEGKRVHMVTLNDGLAKQKAACAEKVFSMLNISVGVIDRGSDNKAAYLNSITYGSYTAFAFDGVRDKMRNAGDHTIHDVAVIDEVDRVLIHESRTPLVIARPKDLDVAFYREADRIACKWIAQQSEQNVFFEQDAKHPYCMTITPVGLDAIGQKVDAELLHQIERALSAHLLYQRDREYVVKDDCVIILDQKTGRLTPNRRFSEGLHQALEVKEQVVVKPEIQIEGRLLVQDYFKMYSKLAGVTATAHVHEDEFQVRYGLTVGVVPTRQALNRIDFEDRVYNDVSKRDEAVVDEVRQYSQKMGRPVLVGVTNIEDLRRLAQLFQARHMDCQILHAVEEDQESQIIARAGQVGVVTLATGMIGRGTDIQLDDEVLRLGGLHVIGCGRHTLRAYDDQLKVRTGKLGQSGSSQFFLCRDDEIVQDIWEDMCAEDKKALRNNGVVENKGVTDLIAGAQTAMAQKQFELRKELDEF